MLLCLNRVTAIIQMFFIERIFVFFMTFLTIICIKWVPVDPRTIFLATIFTQKMPESSGSMYSSILILENI